ncbi:MAG: hypothetical protein RH982_04520 [Parvibaculum sp.]
MTGRENKPGTGRRLLWFAGLWLAGVLALAAFAFGARALLGL